MKKIVSALLITSLLAAGAGSALAAEAEKTDTMPLNSATEAAFTKAVASHSGKVTELRPYYDTEGKEVAGKAFVSIEEDGAPYTFVVDENTFIATGTKLGDIKEGDFVTGYYDTNRPVIMIYPPQYQALVLEVNPETTITVDVFDEALLSSDGSLRLHIGEKTVVENPDGTAYTGENFENHVLVVYYTIVAQSMPAQTTPERIVVLDKVEKIGQDTVVAQYLVNGNAVEASDYFVTEDEVVMVPLRALAEALGYTVGWDNESKSVTLNAHISLSIGVDSYIFARMAPISLGTAPELVGDLTYVPLQFFNEVLQQISAELVDGQIIIFSDVAEETDAVKTF